MLKLKIIICITAILALSFSVQAQEKDWLLTALMIELIADCLQTNYIYDNPDNFYEKNPVLKAGMKQHGRIFIPLYFGGYYLIARKIAKSNFQYKKQIIGVMILGESKTILQNSSLGIGLSFKFYF